MIDFPANPIIGQQFSAAGVTWTWDGAKWVAGGLSPTVVPGINDNRIINGDMRIDQRNNGASGTATGVYTVDRWAFAALQTGKGTWGRNLGGQTGPAALGFPFSLGFSSSSAYASLAGDNFGFFQRIEADNVSDFCWGTVNAQPVTLSFWVFSSLSGTFSGAITNQPSPGTRSYPFTFNIPAANTWTKIVVTIPGDTAGTWALQGNAAALILIFDLGSGTTFRGPAGAWASSNYWGVTGAVSVVATNGATYNITGVKLEIGPTATPFNRQSLAKSMADCQRYYQAYPPQVQGYNVAAGGIGETLTNLVTMRAAPTAVLSGQAYTNASGAAVGNLQPASIFFQGIVTATGTGVVFANVALSAEL